MILVSRKPTEGIDYVTRDYEGFKQGMIDELGIRMPEYTDRSQTDAGIVIIELLSKGLDILSYYMDAIANETLLPTLRRRGSANVWCNILSYIPRRATPSETEQVFVLSSVQDEDFTIPAGTQVKTKGTAIEEEVIFETLEDLVIQAGDLGDEVNSSDEYIYKVRAVQGVSVNSEYVGSSDGTPNQKFPLSYSPVIYSSVEVVVNEGDGFEPWTKVDNFIDSGPNDKHYILFYTDNNIAYVQFGDGVLGKIPTQFSGGIFASYRVGGGVVGNIGANKVVLMETPIALIASTFNPSEVLVKGEDDETVEEIKRNAPKYPGTRWGALTLSDFEFVVLQSFPQVIFASSEVDSVDVDDIHIYLVTTDGASVSNELRNKILELFDENVGGRKIVGADDIYIEPAVLVPVNVTMTVIVGTGYSRASIESQIQDYVQDYFKVGNYPFNTPFSTSSFVTKIMTEGVTEGIVSITISQPSSPVLTPNKNQIYSLGTLVVNTTGGEP